MKRSLGRLGAVAAAVLALCLGSTATASADAYWPQPFGPKVTFKGVGVSMGTYHSQVHGQGTWVSDVRGWPQLNSPVGTVCNWTVTAEFFDANGAWYKTVESPVQQGCNSYWNQGNRQDLVINEWMKVGQVCSSLRESGNRVTSSCFHIG